MHEDANVPPGDFPTSANGQTRGIGQRTGLTGLPARLVHVELDLGVVVGYRLADEHEALHRGLHRPSDAAQRPARSLRLEGPIGRRHERRDLFEKTKRTAR